MTKRREIRLKRVYEAAGPDDGVRILVDRLWPRGISKESARIDLWLKEIAPTTALRQWFGHDPAKWTEFQKRYFRELDKSEETVEQLINHTRQRTVTLVYGAKDPEHNNAVALKKYLESAGRDV